MDSRGRCVSLDGRTALVTGGTSGIGRAVADRLAAAGASLVVVARRGDAVKSTIEELGAGGTAAIGVAGSVTDPDVRAEAVGRAVEELGGLDVLVNCAAMRGPDAHLVDVDAETSRAIWETNQEAPVRLAVAAWEAAMRDRGGAIVNVASIGGVVAQPAHGPYCASKAALIHLTRQLALELAPGVRVNAVAPGLVDTPMTRPRLAVSDVDALARARPLGRLGRPEDIAEAVCFLASDAASWVTGQVLLVDGGASLLSA